jgi:hypothetical protein
LAVIRDKDCGAYTRCLQSGNEGNGGNDGNSNGLRERRGSRGGVAIVTVLLEGKQAGSAVGRNRVATAVGALDTDELTNTSVDKVVALKVASVDGALKARARSVADGVSLRALELEESLGTGRRREGVLGLEEREEALDLAVCLGGGVRRRYLSVGWQLAVTQVGWWAHACTECCGHTHTHTRVEKMRLERHIHEHATSIQLLLFNR